MTEPTKYGIKVFNIDMQSLADKERSLKVDAMGKGVFLFSIDGRGVVLADTHVVKVIEQLRNMVEAHA